MWTGTQLKMKFIAFIQQAILYYTIYLQYIFEEGYFCSELVAKCLKLCGLLATKKASSCFWPANFTEEKNL